ncbi:MAG: nicotinamide riboside transporter PnuC [Crocinitomicaceae bacterium]|nr:nicotinamide riboside transporter PnuC [Crocinitomicaceae bacterium]
MMEGMGFFETLLGYVLETSMLEWIAVVTGLIYVILASYQSLWCWFFAIISSGLYVYICIDFDLYIESGLQLFYVAMAILGWFSWKKTEVSQTDNRNLNAAKNVSTIEVWSLKIHLINIIVSGVAAFILGWIFENYTNQSNPYMDSFTTIFSLLATFMVTKRVLENWIYWIVIDLVAIFLYSSRGLYLSSILYTLFTFLAVFGLLSWYKEYKSSLS